ncbi:hypothetical protein, partial [Chryseobacterium contaminans]|uniref:hypothetical protein n=1 Tax=Chryseobacterium contaminans TaxID=1423959 RepID=UPI0013F4E898
LPKFKEVIDENGTVHLNLDKYEEDPAIGILCREMCDDIVIYAYRVRSIVEERHRVAQEKSKAKKEVMQKAVDEDVEMEDADSLQKQVDKLVKASLAKSKGKNTVSNPFTGDRADLSLDTYLRFTGQEERQGEGYEEEEVAFHP